MVLDNDLPILTQKIRTKIVHVRIRYTKIKRMI
jgi:hypothetical protein